MNTLFYREMHPEGWLRRQLEIQAAGLSGNLDKVWPDVRDSAWIGGDREGWERVPYWLDGFIPLAHLLEKEDLIARADHYVHSIVARQQEDGWICPCGVEERETYDVWAALLIGKVLALHCEFEDDPAVETALYRALKNLYTLLKDGSIRLFDWGKFRWYEGFVPLLHLYRRKPEAWMMDFARILKTQGADYPSMTELWKRPLNKWTFETHVVNVCMMLKYEAMCTELLGDSYQNQAEELWQILDVYNGTAVGAFTGDECLSGIGNQQGTELCAVVELMYACEWLYRITGDAIWADRLEKVAFNALPATFLDDMWTHQYDQMVNQVACIEFPGKSFFRTNPSESHLFGLEPNYGCCTANFSQGWPKLALHALQRMETGLCLAHLLPFSANIQLDGKPVSVQVSSNYPFRLSADITVDAPQAVPFALQIRIPAWAKHVCINGQPAMCDHQHIVLDREWSGRETLHLTMEATPQLMDRPTGLKVAEYGALVFSLPIETEYRMKEFTRDRVERKYPYCDYELIPKSEWRFGFADDALSVKEQEIAETPFSAAHSPITLTAKLAPVAWEWADGYDTVPAVAPASTQATGAVRAMQLIPYGCAKLRMTEMPKVTAS